MARLPISNASLQAASAHLGTIDRVVPILGGQRSTFQVVGTRSGILKVFPADSDSFSVECAVLRALDGRYDSPRLLTSGQDDISAFILMSLLPGRPLAALYAEEHFPRGRALVNAAEVLGRIHEGLRALPTDGQSSFPLDALGELAGRPQTFLEAFNLQARRAEPYLGTSRLARILAVVEQHSAILEHANAALQVIHGDYQPRNVLVDESAAVTGIVDWELARFGAPLCDLAMLLRFCETPSLEHDVIRAYREPNLPVDEVRFASRCYDVAKITLGMSRAPSLPSDIAQWSAYVDECLEFLTGGAHTTGQRSALSLLFFATTGH